MATAVLATNADHDVAAVEELKTTYIVMAKATFLIELIPAENLPAAITAIDDILS